MKKLMMLLVLGLVLTGALWAAGAQESAAEDVTLSVLWFNDANESQVFMDTIQDYLEANPNV